MHTNCYMMRDPSVHKTINVFTNFSVGLGHDTALFDAFVVMHKYKGTTDHIVKIWFFLITCDDDGHGNIINALR